MISTVGTRLNLWTLVCLRTPICNTGVTNEITNYCLVVNDKQQKST